MQHLQQESSYPLRSASQDDLFCVAPLDILVTEEHGPKRFHLIELNGTGIGGLTNLSSNAVSAVLESLYQMAQRLPHEAELRFGLRNPIMQLITNKFAKSLRVRVRAWSLGLPLATLLSSIVLGILVNRGQAAWVPRVGAGCGLLYLAGSLGLVQSFSENTAPVPAPGRNGRRIRLLPIRPPVALRPRRTSR